MLYTGRCNLSSRIIYFEWWKETTRAICFCKDWFEIAFRRSIFRLSDPLCTDSTQNPYQTCLRILQFWLLVKSCLRHPLAMMIGLLSEHRLDGLTGLLDPYFDLKDFYSPNDLKKYLFVSLNKYILKILW